ncbi:MBL fold metallo-hydrolase RNA specificity domain-containing protein [Nesterenkonia alkaliphila]|uniref:MBL fold metallo-hydrolase n=1 Tax=Nesterenkonia alkaliphila TaxID=1463631 RepID=A0A7K1UKN9_9MICC|nr:MBL fold metallo-hydrolase [Nesterenkonia alkaliphila]MVT27055.1 MBL fold metallo-hydrolase [Nesterenkonia alkaliphila]GFZ93846.1 MBL fold metallo-hydrolase [Nesterenkonia alkaliphila]
MAGLRLTSLGGAGTVTGSKHLLERDGDRILIDCGLFQGQKNLRELNWKPLPVEASSIDAVILTHAHLDYCGYLPRLVREGFTGPIISTKATRDVAELILKDSAWLQEQDAAFLNRIKKSKHSPALPLYDSRDAQRALDAFITYPFDQPFETPNGATVRFRRAGHILGAATVDIRWDTRRIVFSGDLGRYDDPVMIDPEPVPEADYVVIESTYGDRLHQTTRAVDALADVVERTSRRGGTVLIPSFAVGRAQTLLYYLWSLRQSGRLPQVPMYLDSPMAINASDLLHAHPDDHRLDPQTCDAVGRIATYTRDPEDSKRISRSSAPKIVISASGMATGGRILHHLKAFGPDRRHTILLAGYQAAGTRGRALLEGAQEIKIHGDWIPITAEVANLPGLSAHADADELLRWLSGFRRAPEKVFIVHGEPQAAETLRTRVDRELAWEAVVPRQNQVFQL